MKYNAKIFNKIEKITDKYSMLISKHMQDNRDDISTNEWNKLNKVVGSCSEISTICVNILNTINEINEKSKA